jgi:hypothetical protein
MTFYFSLGYCDISQPWPGAGNVTSDPKFVSATDDFRLQSGSPCMMPAIRLPRGRLLDAEKDTRL